MFKLASAKTEKQLHVENAAKGFKGIQTGMGVAALGGGVLGGAGLLLSKHRLVRAMSKGALGGAAVSGLLSSGAGRSRRGYEAALQDARSGKKRDPDMMSLEGISPTAYREALTYLKSQQKTAGVKLAKLPKAVREGAGGMVGHLMRKAKGEGASRQVFAGRKAKNVLNSVIGNQPPSFNIPGVGRMMEHFQRAKPQENVVLKALHRARTGARLGNVRSAIQDNLDMTPRSQASSQARLYKNRIDTEA